MERLDFIKLFTWKGSSSHQDLSTYHLKNTYLNVIIKANIILGWIYKMGLRSKHVNLGCIMIMKRIKICHPKICHFGIRIMLSWRQLRNSRHRRNSLPFPFCLTAEHKFLITKVSSLTLQYKRRQLSLETKSTLKWVCTNRPNPNNL